MQGTVSNPRPRKKSGNSNSFRVLFAFGWHDVRLQEGALHYASQAGWHVNTRMLYDSEIPLGWKGDGILVMFPVESQRPAYDELIRQSGASCVALCTAPDLHHLPHVSYDNDAIARMVTNHFVERGFRNFLFYTDESNWVTEGRRSAFIRHLGMHGFDCLDLPRLRSPGEKLSKRVQDLGSAIRSLPKPLAVWAVNDLCACTVLQACQERSIAVPNEVSILGCDNYPYLASETKPSLSSVDSGFDLISYRAAELLDQLMRRTKPSTLAISVPPRGIVVRESTDTYATDIPQVRRVIELIQKNYSKKLNSQDFCRAAGLSRMRLHILFKRVFHQSPVDILNRYRMRAAESLLLTSEKISTVAQSCGFKSAGVFWRSFLREHQIPPHQWRQKQKANSIYSNRPNTNS